MARANFAACERTLPVPERRQRQALRLDDTVTAPGDVMDAAPGSAQIKRSGRLQPAFTCLSTPAPYLSSPFVHTREQ